MRGGVSCRFKGLKRNCGCAEARRCGCVEGIPYLMPDQARSERSTPPPRSGLRGPLPAPMPCLTALPCPASKHTPAALFVRDECLACVVGLSARHLGHLGVQARLLPRGEDRGAHAVAAELGGRGGVRYRQGDAATTGMEGCC